MIDDYQFRPQQLPGNDRGPFGFGKIAQTGYNSGVSAGGEGGAPAGAPTGTPDPTTNTTNPQDVSDPAGTTGDILRYDSDRWTTVSPPTGGKESIFVNSSGVGGGSFVQGNQAGGLIYFDGLQWQLLDGSTSGEKVFILKNGELQWLDAPLSGTRVLGSIDGSVQWIGTESCEPDPE